MLASQPARAPRSGRGWRACNDRRHDGRPTPADRDLVQDAAPGGGALSADVGRRLDPRNLRRRCGGDLPRARLRRPRPARGAKDATGTRDGRDGDRDRRLDRADAARARAPEAAPGRDAVLPQGPATDGRPAEELERARLPQGHGRRRQRQLRGAERLELGSRRARGARRVRRLDRVAGSRRLPDHVHLSLLPLRGRGAESGPRERAPEGARGGVAAALGSRHDDGLALGDRGRDHRDARGHHSRARPRTCSARATRSRWDCSPASST